MPFVRCLERCRGGGQATDDSMVHEHFMLDTQGYRHILRICNTCYFTTVRKVARTRPNITLHAHRVSCYECNRGLGSAEC